MSAEGSSSWAAEFPSLLPVYNLLANCSHSTESTGTSLTHNHMHTASALSLSRLKTGYFYSSLKSMAAGYRRPIRACQR